MHPAVSLQYNPYGRYYAVPVGMSTGVLKLKLHINYKTPVGRVVAIGTRTSDTAVDPCRHSWRPSCRLRGLLGHQIYCDDCCGHSLGVSVNPLR